MRRMRRRIVIPAAPRAHECGLQQYLEACHQYLSRRPWLACNGIWRHVPKTPILEPSMSPILEPPPVACLQRYLEACPQYLSCVKVFARASQFS